MLYASKLQNLVTLSTTEAEYVSLSEGLRETIPVMDFLEEIARLDFTQVVRKTVVRCKAFEDNEGTLKLVLVHKLRPRTKHINSKYHHFRSHVRTGRITIHAIDTKEQIVDW